MIDNVDIKKVQKELLEEDTIIDIAELLKVFAESSYNEVKAESEYFFELYERILG